MFLRVVLREILRCLLRTAVKLLAGERKRFALGGGTGLPVCHALEGQGLVARWHLGSLCGYKRCKGTLRLGFPHLQIHEAVLNFGPTLWRFRAQFIGIKGL